ncbi:MAG: redoxin domain-containing protein [Anaerolineae bacterium]
MPKWIQIRVVSDEEPLPAGEGAEEQGSRGAGEQGSRGAGERGSEGAFSSVTQHLGAAAQRAPLHLRTLAPPHRLGRLLTIGSGLVALGLVAVVVWFFVFRGGDQPATAAVAQPSRDAVPMPAGQLSNQVAPRAGDPAPSGSTAAVDDTGTDPVSADVARRLASERRVAIVNGEPITEAMLEREVGIGRVLYPLLRGILVENDAQTLERMRADLLSSLIDERLLVQAAEEAGVTISEADLDVRLDKMLSDTGLSVEDLVDQLSTVGVSIDDLRASLRATMLAERFVKENPPPDNVSAQSDHAAWVKVLHKQGDVQILTGEDVAKTAKIGQPAPDFTLRDPKGETVRLSDFAGQPLLINFWATWCPPCRFEMPLLQQTYEKLKDDGFMVLAVDVQEGPELVKPYIENMGLTFPVALDRGGAVATTYRVAALPTTVFVDSNGIVTDIHRGALIERTLQRYLDDILE